MRVVFARTWMWGVAGVALSAAVGAGQGEQPPRFGERVNVSRMLIDVRVVSPAGDSVLGLKAGDFGVTIGRLPARVDNAVWIGGEAPAPTRGSDVTVSAPQSDEQVPRRTVLLFQRSLANHV